ncbi:MAG: Yip1 family protein [Verrucomicrobia bacterium]|nr:Yip1 family protein [Verrucomicrobiota bacterium]
MKTQNNSTSVAPETGGNKTNGYYASGDHAKQVREIAGREIVEPEIDKPALRITAFTNGRAGESGVRETAARNFGALNNQHVEEIHGVLEMLEHAIAGAGRHIREISNGMNPAKRYIHTNTAGTPWTRASRVLFWFFIIISVVLLAVGINTNANVLRSSGIPAFENLIAAYLFSGIPIALAACLKGLFSYVQGDSRRRVYIIVVWVIGFLFGVIWAYLFAEIFRGITQSTAEIVRSLTEAGSATAAPNSNWVFVFVAIIAETFLSAGCWLTAQTIAEKHQLEELADNPAYLKQQKDLDQWSKVQHEYVQLRGCLNGKLQAIENKSRETKTNKQR